MESPAVGRRLTAFSDRRRAVAAAAATLAFLGGGVALAFPVMLALSTLAPTLTERMGRTLFFAVMALVCGAGGALWGAHLGRRTATRSPRAVAIAGALGFGISTPTAALAASAAETFLLDSAQRGVEYPMHLAFALVFGGALLLVVGATTLAVALAAGRGARSALRVAAAVAATAAGAFLAVDVAFDLAGWRVGAPGAEARATMLVVLGAGLVVATAAAGAVAGRAVAPDAGR